MSNKTLEQTLSESRALQQKYKKFLSQKAQSDKKWEQSQKRINKTILKYEQTKDSLRKIDQMYDKFEKTYENIISEYVSAMQKDRLLEVAIENFEPNYLNCKEIETLIKNKKKVIILTGAGITAGSGIPTFRGKDGFWTKKKEQKVDPEQFLTLINFRQNQFDIWDWVQEFYCLKNKSLPNKGHIALNQICSKLCNKNIQTCIVTQNIDNFHNQVKTQDIYNIYQTHGNALKIRCDQCVSSELTLYDYSQYRKTIIQNRKSPICPKCNKNMRPHIMFYDETYTERLNKFDTIKQFLKVPKQTDNLNDTKENRNQQLLLIVIGTSLMTGMARTIAQNCVQQRADIIQINLECIIKQNHTYWMQSKSDEALRQINNYVRLQKKKNKSPEKSAQRKSHINAKSIQKTKNTDQKQNKNTYFDKK